MYLGYFYYLIPLFQIIAAVHVLKTGRNWYWLWIIFFFPLVGVAVYFFVEMAPDFRRFSFQSILNAVIPGRPLRPP